MIRARLRLATIVVTGLALGVGGEVAAWTARQSPYRMVANAPSHREPAESSHAGAAAGSIAGTVRFTGEPPAARIYSIEHDTFCMSAHGAEAAGSHRLVLDDRGGVRWAFVYIREVVEGSLPIGEPTPVTLDKVGCAYEPHVLGMQAGATLHILNSDPTLHTVQLEASENPSFNIALPRRGMDIVRVLANPEVMIPVRCNVHPWTQAYVGVVPHSFFAVTDAQGRFVIDGVPEGEYVLEAWHEILGRRTLGLTVGEAEATEVGFSFERLPEAGGQD